LEVFLRSRDAIAALATRSSEYLRDARAERVNGFYGLTMSRKVHAELTEFARLAAHSNAMEASRTKTGAAFSEC